MTLPARCATCRHWVEVSPTVLRPCALSSSEINVWTSAIVEPRAMTSIEYDDPAWKVRGTRLYVAEDFGCVLHEPKEGT